MRHGEQELPKSSAADRSLIDPSDSDLPVLIHPLANGMDCSRDQAIAHLMDTFKRVWMEYWNRCLREDKMNPFSWTCFGEPVKSHDGRASQGDLDR